MTSPGSMIAHAREEAASLPYPDLPDANIAILENALRIAWRETCADPTLKVNLLTCEEEDISAKLIEVLDLLASNTKRAPLKNFSEFFHVGIPEVPIATKTRPLAVEAAPSVEADAECSKADDDETSKRKRPDLSFWPKTLPSGYARLWYAIYIEAKLLDGTKTIGLYARKGLKRFTSGRYGWSMSQGLMLGYLRQPDVGLPQTLHSHLDQRQDQYGVLEMPKAFSLSRNKMLMHETRHKRSAVYRDTGTPLPPIRVFHLWLPVPD